MTSIRWLLVTISLGLFGACGGRSEDDDSTGGTGGTTGGTSAAGGDAGVGGSTGGAGTGGGTGGNAAAGKGADGSCNAFPTCDTGDVQVVRTCPLAGACYTRTFCGNTIMCSKACEPDVDYNYHYYVSGGHCATADFVCPEHTQVFDNDCGCGCVQAFDCLPVLDCAPSPDPNPSCSEEATARCPYSPRAL